MPQCENQMFFMTLGSLNFTIGKSIADLGTHVLVPHERPVPEHQVEEDAVGLADVEEGREVRDQGVCLRWY